LLASSNERVIESPSAPASGPSTWHWGGAIFLSAFLLFQVQPILAKLVLPWFGGAAGVWTVSLAFYQLTYLFGNLYAHYLIQRGGPRLSTRLHAFVLAASLLFLPILPNPFWQPRGAEVPEWRILGLLAVTVGLPFLLLSATSPVLQAWHTLGNEGARPYRFYALSNAGSLLALLSYPLLVEPHLSTRHQAVIWSVAYGGFALLCAVLALRLPAAKLVRVVTPAAERPKWTLQLLWVALAATASAVLLAVTHHISQNIAAIPLLWIVPLSLYLLSLIFCFEGHRWYQRPFYLRVLPVALGGMAYALSPEFENAGPILQVPLFCAGLFVCCMACHGEMADLKPRPEYLTLFYLMVSAGGALGGIFVGVAAPRLFRGFYELPAALGMCALLMLIVLYREADTSPHKWGQPALLAAAGLTALMLVFLFHVTRRLDQRARVMVRNFYGVLRVDDVAPGAVRPALRQLLNGTIVHGAQILDIARRATPTTYYGTQSGAGIALLLARQQGNIRVGVIGLGVGTLARYGQEGDHYLFYEINPLVVDLANTQFDFLRESLAHIEIVPGDARLSLENQPPQEFDVLVVDAFSSDAIPVHLLTREAFELYFRHLKPQGVLAVHVSNRFLDLPPVVEAAARDVGARATKVVDDNDEERAVYGSTWMLLDRRIGPPPTLEDASPPQTAEESEEKIVPTWTDDYSNLIEILK
jgi:SAM-dependent methyltransferase